MTKLSSLMIAPWSLSFIVAIVNWQMYSHLPVFLKKKTIISVTTKLDQCSISKQPN